MVTRLTELSENVGLQNVYTPLPIKMHLGLCIIATVLYLVQYYRKGSLHYLILMLAIDLTFFTQTQMCHEKGFINLLGWAEAVLLIAAMISYIFYSKKLKAANAAAEAEADAEEERRRTAERLQAEHDKNVVENAFEDGE